jgi:protoporphyrin/coproporphyrin ferrochelatase
MTTGPPGEAPIGVLVMAHGTPADLEDLQRFVTEIRRGRPPEPELLAELARRYETIGGTSPLAERTAWHAEAIAGVLDQRAPGRFKVEIGYKFARPKIEEGVANLAAAGVVRGIGIVLAPHYSAMSIGDYARRAEAAAEAVANALDRPIEISTVPNWHLAPGFVPLLAGLLRSCLDDLPDPERARATVVFTAHSLPERILEHGDPYADQLRQSADAVASAADVERYTVAWQSAGRSNDRWLGPDILEVISDLAETGAPTVIVCPVGFVSEHLEVLYDLDVEAARVASEAGIRFMRTPSLDGDIRLAEVLAGVVLEATDRTDRIDRATDGTDPTDSTDRVTDGIDG